MRFENEVFGTAPQQEVSRRARVIWPEYMGDPNLAYNGRIVVGIGETDPKKLIKLARAQGASTVHFLPRPKMQAMMDAIVADGLDAGMWELCVGAQGAYDAALKMIADFALPQDLTIVQMGVDTPADQVAGLARVAADCGVMPMTGRVIRGLDIDGVTLGAVDQAGEVVASAWGYKCYPDHPKFSDYTFWGGLACRPDRRGQKIAQILGAHSIVRLWDDLGVRGFATGVAPDNAVSFAVCEKLGVFPSDWVAVGATDASMFKGGKLTK